MDTQTTTDIGISEFVMLEMAFNEEDRCEHSAHGTNFNHSGVGEWYVQFEHSSCGNTGIRIFCDKWVQYAMRIHNRVYCSKCGDAVFTNEIYKSFWRKGSTP